MNKISLFLTIILLICALSGCTTDTNTDNSTDTAKEVNLLPDADIIIPSGLAGSEVTGIEKVSDNNDGTITYTLKGNERTDILNKLSDDLTISIQDILNNNDYYPNIEAITSNDDLTLFTIELTDGQMNVYESMLVMSFYTIGDKYQLYNGVSSDEVKTTVVYTNTSTGEVISTSDSTSMDTFSPN